MPPVLWSHPFTWGAGGAVAAVPEAEPQWVHFPLARGPYARGTTRTNLGQFGRYQSKTTAEFDDYRQ